MMGRKGLAAALVLAFVAGGIGGVALGGYQGFQKGASFILNECLSKDAREIGTRVGVLRDLRAGKQAPALESLEAGMDDLLVGFDPAEPYPGLTPQTTAALGRAIAEAKAYRAAHPRESRGHARDAMVRDLLSRERYK
jgi:hypothetical protein